MARGLCLLILLAPALAAADLKAPPRPAGTVTFDQATFARHWVRACGAFARRDPCELRADLDGDGRPERVVKVRARRGGAAGLAVLWRSGKVSVLGGGLAAEERTIDVDIHGNDDGGPREGPRDLGGLAHWRVAAQAKALAALGVGLQGIRLDGGDATEDYYFVDGGWVAVILGF